MITQQLRELGLSQTIEIFVDNTSQSKFRFSDNLTNLDNALVHAIYIGTGAIGKSPLQRTMLDTANLLSSFLTLAGTKNEIYNERLPVLEFYLKDKNILFFKPKLINFRNSYIEIADIATLVIPAGGYSVLFTVFYEPFDPAVHKLDASGELIEPED